MSCSDYRGLVLLPSPSSGFHVVTLLMHAVLALKAEGTRMPTAPYFLATFDKPEPTRLCKVLCDSDVGGLSRARLDWEDPTSTSTSASSEGLRATSDFMAASR